MWIKKLFCNTCHLNFFHGLPRRITCIIRSISLYLFLSFVCMTHGMHVVCNQIRATDSSSLIGRVCFIAFFLPFIRLFCKMLNRVLLLLFYFWLHFFDRKPKSQKLTVPFCKCSKILPTSNNQFTMCNVLHLCSTKSCTESTTHIYVYTCECPCVSGMQHSQMHRTKW